MEVIQIDEAWERIECKIKFSYVRVFVRQDGILYTGKWNNRLNPPTMLKHLQELRQVSTEDWGPKVKETWSGVYVKTPSLVAYVDRNLENQITREIKTCQILRENPHPSIAIYYSFTESDGRVSGLCFRRYVSTLLETVNPRRLGKAAFRSSRRRSVTEDMRSGLDGVLAAIKHLHSLGLVHNDVNPANIILDEDGTLVLIDFESCRYVGELLRNTETKRTHHWHDPSIDISLERNDLDAFKILLMWGMQYVLGYLHTSS
ncbi:kinase-like protein [Aspergillus avenaceus]|uniref:Kinase-like protein n=1 Tax=Aspergillus avenaceus TaxID=36643 RepID=A0A5N6TKQ4_ASPAV|nr:kinase-like protein [Aspergillus avenaceus]